MVMMCSHLTGGAKREQLRNATARMSGGCEGLAQSGHPHRMQSPTDPCALASAVLTNRPHGHEPAVLLPFFFVNNYTHIGAAGVHLRTFVNDNVVAFMQSHTTKGHPIPGALLLCSPTANDYGLRSMQPLKFGLFRSVNGTTKFTSVPNDSPRRSGIAPTGKTVA